MKLSEIFTEALSMPNESERMQFLEVVCGHDIALRRDVEELLEEHDKDADCFLDQPPPGIDAGVVTGVVEKPGYQIGPYTLRERIGEGGMGIVFVADQKVPIQREVALKIIKPGMDTEEVISRFEAERQALAMMDHQNIAKVLDAGSTDTGRPYFVMEWVKGVPITEYCDSHRLTARKRLELFATVCRAVQHAHQKGIIHRDLKPSNVMVAQSDGAPLVKIIDFGVAKAINQRLCDRPYTRFQDLVGTPLYMSPEQADPSESYIDTRSDVYSLGVVLYELLTGTTPFDQDRLHKAAIAEIRRIICEDQPDRPSTRVSTFGPRSNKILKHRSTDAVQLQKVLRADIDWVVLKSLAKERDRRYDSATSFADDIDRVLANEPVLAHRPSKAYQLRKFVQRNKGLVVAAASITVVVAASIVATSVGFIRAERSARRAAEEARIARSASNKLEKANRDLARVLLHQAIAAAMSGDREQTEHYVKNASQYGATEAQRELVLGVMHWAMANDQLATQHLERAVQLDQDSVAARAVLGGVHIQAGQADMYFKMQGEALSRPPITAEDHMFLAMSLFPFRPEHALELAERSLELHQSPTARVIYAGVLNENAIKHRDLESATTALKEVAQAQTILGQRAFVLSARLSALTTSILLGRLDGQDTTQHETAADELAQALLRHDYLRPIQARGVALYYDFVKNDPTLTEAAWQVALEEPGDSWRALYAAYVWREHGLDDALNVVRTKNMRSGHGLAIELHLKAFHENSNDEALRLWQQLPRSHPTETNMAILAAGLVGDHDRARTLGMRWRESASEWDRLVIDFAIGVLPEGDFLASDHTPALLHYFAGLKSLGQREREKARQHFQQVVDGHHYTYWTFGWAKACLAELERDPDWPHPGKFAPDAVRPGRS